MERTEARLADEWKANNDLYKFYEDLKQKRFAHFLTIQTAFLAIFGLLTKEAMGAFSLVSLAAMFLATLPPLFIAFHFIRVDARGRAFVDTANTRLLLIEAEWKARFPDDYCATYQQQFALLVRHDASTVDEYLAVRNIDADQYPALVRTRSAHASEAAVLKLFWWLWVVLCTGTLVHLLWHLAHPLYRPS
ncbi:MAG: hypothetical protein ABI624_01115 [Casimicrobiaceae bacterium]